MIDTIDIFHEFESIEQYNRCYKLIDDLAGKATDGKNRLHKNRDHLGYSTTFLKFFGFSEIEFVKYKKYRRYVVKLIIKPIRFIYPGSHVRLAGYEDYEEIERKFNFVIRIFNAILKEKILPFFADWRVGRIDYTINISTPYVKEYLWLFYCGNVPKNFEMPQAYTDSFYLLSSESRVNFYDKIAQLKTKQNLTPDDLRQIQETKGLLRLEIQCLNKNVLRLKDKYSLADSSVKNLWNKEIARDVLRKHIFHIIGRENFFKLDECTLKLKEHYGIRTVNRCRLLMKAVVQNPRKKLKKLKSIKNFSDVNQLVFKIRQAGVNVIALDILPYNELEELKNPYNLISF